jgi:hypothetical protein
VSSEHHLQPTVDRLLSGLREQLEAAMRVHAEAAAQRAIEDVRRQADAEIAQVREAAKVEADESRKLADAQLADLRLMLDELRRSAQQQIDEARRTLDSSVAAARARAESDIDEARRQAQSQVEEMQRETDSRVFELSKQLTESREAAARSTRLLDVMRLIDESSSLGALLDRLAQFAGREIDRAALLIVRNDMLCVSRLIGFDLDGQRAEPMDVPVTEPGLLGSAVREGHITRLRRDDPSAALPSFASGSGPRAAAAFPLIVGGAVVAVLYADSPSLDDDMEPDWCARMATVTRYASRVLEALTVELTIGLRPLLVQPSHAAAGHQLPEGAQ